MEPSHLPAETAFRLRAVANTVRRHLHALPERPSILAAGDHPLHFVREFTQAFPRWRATAAGTSRGGAGNYVCGSPGALPFRSASFDVAVSLDALEHVPPAGRPRFTVELCRAAKSFAILTAPFHHPATAAVERILDQAHRHAFGRPHPALAQHVEHGLPDLREVLSQWPAGFGVQEVIPCYGLRAWLTWHALALVREQRGELDRNWTAWQQAYTAEPAPPPGPVPYAWILVARRGGATRPLSAMQLPDPEADADLPELARLYARLLEAGAGRGEGETTIAGKINQRLKRALLAAEKELDAERQRKAPPGIRELLRETLRRWLS